MNESFLMDSDGDFFAVKEVSLIDQGSQAQECIQQLERVRYIYIYSLYHLSKVGCLSSSLHLYRRLHYLVSFSTRI